ncbi:MAG TPA: DUF1080 domain-containing protein [Opitutales bacterium]|nr:DUF1080 domain-containing protein [Opitutales bacterium]
MKRFLGLALALAAAWPLHAQNTYPVSAGADDAGFTPIFDGKTLNGWEGDKVHWRVEDGCIVGEITANTTIRVNTFLIWRGGAPKDFELKVEYRISDHGNSGVNYRSAEVEDVPLALKGYQFDLDGEKRNNNGVRYTGQNYEERGRTFLALRGQITRVGGAGQPPQIIGSLGDDKDLLGVIKNGDWNELHIIARGNTLIHILNGRVLDIVVDEDPAGRRFGGLIGVQVHQGPPMKIEYRRFLLKNLDPIPTGPSANSPGASTASVTTGKPVSAPSTVAQ